MKTTNRVVILLLSLTLLGSPALAQLTCSVVGQTAVCVGPNGTPPVIQQQLNPNTGVIIQPDGNVTPYTILTPNAPGAAAVAGTGAPNQHSHPPRRPRFWSSRLSIA